MYKISSGKSPEGKEEAEENAADAQPADDQGRAAWVGSGGGKVQMPADDALEDWLGTDWSPISHRQLSFLKRKWNSKQLLSVEPKIRHVPWRSVYSAAF